MSDLHGSESPSRLGIMAAVAERVSSMDASLQSSKSFSLHPSPHADSTPSKDSAMPKAMTSPTSDPSQSGARRAKLVLPDLTPEMQEDLDSGRGASGKVPLSISNRPEWTDYPLKGILGPPHPNDVLCGRGGGSNNHPGNESFRELVNEVKVPYVNCPKREKPLIARRIVEAVRQQTPPGRFLQKDMETGYWNDIGDSKAREKTSQALREGAPIIRDLLNQPSSNAAGAVKSNKKSDSSKESASPSVGPTRGVPDQVPADRVGYPLRAPDHIRDVQQHSAALLPNPSGVPKHVPFRREPYFHKREPNPGTTEHPMPRSPGISPENPISMPSSLPPTKRFYSRGEKDSAASVAHSRWPSILDRGRNPRDLSFVSQPGRIMGGFGVPRRASDYGSGIPKYVDSVPVETVRRLLLGHLDPVQLALQILAPEEAALVARHAAVASFGYRNVPVQSPSFYMHHDAAQVSDDSTSGESQNNLKRTAPLHNDQNGVHVDDTSSDDCSRQSNSEHAEVPHAQPTGPVNRTIPPNALKMKSAGPKKKRKFLEAMQVLPTGP